MKDIKGYEGLYAITSCGKVWSYFSGQFLKPEITEKGYLRVSLIKNGKVKHFKIHRLVAEAYIPNPEGKPQVNHKDEDKTHNYVGNLEWMTSKENNNYGTRNQKIRKPVYCVELDREFESITAAAKELGLSKGNISNALSGKYKTCGGYHWQFAQPAAALT